MNKLMTLIVLLASTNLFAAPLEAVECKRQLMAAGLAERIKHATVDALVSSDFSISNFDYANTYPEFDYIVYTETKSRVDGTSTYVDYGVKLIDAKTCKVTAVLIAD